MRLILRRLASTVPLLIVVSIISFGLVLLVPGNPAASVAGETATPEQIAVVEEQLGLDRSLPVQYWDWISNAVTGDLGVSWFHSRPVTEVVLDKVPVSLGLTMLAIVIALLVAIPVGLYSGSRVGSIGDRVATTLVTAGVAVPNFWLAIMLILLVSLQLGWLPAVGYVAFTDSPGDWLRYSILPAIALGMAAAAEIARQLRGAVAGVLQQDHVRTARAMGLPHRRIMGTYVLRNALLPVVTLTGVQFARLFGAAVIVEQVFAQPGLGQVAVQAISQRDVPVIQGIIMVAAVVTVLVNLGVDLLYTVIDPRLRTS